MKGDRSIFVGEPFHTSCKPASLVLVNAHGTLAACWLVQTFPTEAFWHLEELLVLHTRLELACVSCC